MTTSRIRKAVLPVAGLGSRFLPATKSVAKEMLPLVDRPLIAYAIDEAQAAGIEEFIFVTGPGKDEIAEYFDHDPVLVGQLEAAGKDALADAVRRAALPAGKAAYVRQDQPLGLGHAIWCARHYVGDEPFGVILPDDAILAEKPCMAQLAEAHAKFGGHLAAVVDVPRDQTHKYGILDVENDDGHVARATGLVEKPKPEVAPSTLSIIGRYVLLPGVFEELDKQKQGSGGEIQITDAIAARIGTEGFHGVRFEGTRFDCGSKEGMLEANVAFALANEELAPAMRRIIQQYAEQLSKAA